MVGEFFAALIYQLKEVEKDVMSQLRSCTKLKDIVDILETFTLDFDEELLMKLEETKNVLEDRVGQARYGYIVSRKEHYNQLIKQMEDFNIKLS